MVKNITALVGICAKNSIILLLRRRRANATRRPKNNGVLEE
jgi:hypothetical protein